jgi:hypothetical protein
LVQLFPDPPVPVIVHNHGDAVTVGRTDAPLDDPVPGLLVVNVVGLVTVMVKIPLYAALLAPEIVTSSPVKRAAVLGTV